MNILKQSTAVTLRVGPFLDEDDGKTAEVALTISQADVRLSLNHGAFAQKADTSSATHEEFGWYQVPINTTDSGTLGNLELAIHESGALPVWQSWTVVPANVYDSLIGDTDKLDTSVVQWLGTAVTAATAGVPNVNTTEVAGTAQDATDLADFAAAGYDPGTNKVQGVVLVDDITTKTGFSLSTAGILAIWHQLESAVVTGSTMGIKLKNWVLGADSKVLISTDAQDLSATLNVDTKTISSSGPAADALELIALNAKGADHKILVSSDAQDLSATFDVNAKLLATAAPNNLAQADIIDDATPFSGANVDAAITTRATPAEVNTQVSDVLKTDTVTLPGQGLPSNTPTMEVMIAYLYKAFKNKQHSDADGWDLYDNAGAVVDQKAVLTDDGTDFNRANVVSGP